MRARMRRLRHLRWAVRAIQAWTRGTFTRRKLAKRGQLIRIGSTRGRVFNREFREVMHAPSNLLCCQSCLAKEGQIGQLQGQVQALT